ncbi:hypothetical protein JNK62_02840 [bacterium]|nr:hypothetical protein [bacterium]
MKAISKILAVALLAASASSASAFVKHDPGVTYEDIKACLENIGLEEGTHFRKKKGSDDTIELNRGQVAGDSYDFKQVDGCWKKQTVSK